MNKDKSKKSILVLVTALICAAIVLSVAAVMAVKISKSKKAQTEESETVTSEEAVSEEEYFEEQTSAYEIKTTKGFVNADGKAVSAAAPQITVPSPVNDVTNASSSSSGKKTNSASASQGSGKITATSGLTSSKKEEVLKYYKLVAAKHMTKTYLKHMNLLEMDGGDGPLVSKGAELFEPIAKRALAKNSVEENDIPGAPEKIQVSDWTSARAVSDGTYTTISVKVKDQTDGPNGTLNGGPVGRSISVLDGLQTALDEMDGVSADFQHGQVSLHYTDAYFTVKVKNSTGEFVKGSGVWHFIVDVRIGSLNARALGFDVPITNASGKIEYTVTY